MYRRRRRRRNRVQKSYRSYAYPTTKNYTLNAWLAWFNFPASIEKIMNKFNIYYMTEIKQKSSLQISHMLDLIIRSGSFKYEPNLIGPFQSAIYYIHSPETYYQTAAQRQSYGTYGYGYGYTYGNDQYYINTGASQSGAWTNNNSKTWGICWDFVRGQCKRGDKCKWSHEKSDAATKKTSERWGVCWDYAWIGYCDRGDKCKWSHKYQSFEIVKSIDLKVKIYENEVKNYNINGKQKCIQNEQEKEKMEHEIKSVFKTLANALNERKQELLENVGIMDKNNDRIKQREKEMNESLDAMKKHQKDIHSLMKTGIAMKELKNRKEKVQQNEQEIVNMICVSDLKRNLIHAIMNKKVQFVLNTQTAVEFINGLGSVSNEGSDDITSTETQGDKIM